MLRLQWPRFSATVGITCCCLGLASDPLAHQQPTDHTVHTISGRIVDPAHLRRESAVLMLGRENQGGFASSRVAVGSDGSFVSAPLSSGTYFLTVNQTPDSRVPVAFEIVDVRTTDVSGVTVTIRRDTALTGRFVMESDTPGAPWPPHIVVNASVAIPGLPSGANIAADGAPGGRFVLRNAFGPRVLRCGYTLPPGTKWWPTRVLLDGVDVTNVPMDFSAHEKGRLEIIFTQHPARVAGTVVDQSGQPVRAPWVLLMSAEPALQEEWATTNDSAQGDTYGHFAIAVTPGRYLIAAVPQTTFRFNPWVEARRNIRRFASRGIPVEAKGRAATTVTLTAR